MAFGAGLKVLFSLAALVLFMQEGSCLSCPSGWVQRQGTYDCYQFKTDTTSWDQARANCHTQEADLTSLDKAGENEWVISQLSGSSIRDDYWIGLSDPFGHLVYVWSDGSIYDPNLANWDSGRPSHSKGTKACVAMGYNPGWAWLDEDCGSAKAYVCHKTLTQPVRCDESNGWIEKFQNCYYLSTKWMTFDDAQELCTRSDANLIDIADEDEQMLLVEFVEEAKSYLWIGYKTIAGRDNFKWTSGLETGFEQWAVNEPNMDALEKCTQARYQDTGTGNWSTTDCQWTRRFICEKPTGMCYPGWRIYDGYCYQMVAYSPTTWVDAKQQCEAQGSTLLTIKDEKEQDFINEQLPVLWQTGISNIWLGISDTITDGEMKWTDGTAYDDTAYQNWPAHKKPANREDEAQCGSIYAGSSIGQWDYGDCFNLFDYSCKIREGNRDF
ncbi:C-type mannose receptor 2-like [Strongylocentrotus purpuratus]|uniref:C-type lectin domain-containing protein n=1 Tax=Strongylocentrotus purpuratus TaxID=7668 RepID=A0A7M7PU42_STRPU|nr:C-type mannose receptor 2-like [Strongylocentrotus purpuratus]